MSIPEMKKEIHLLVDEINDEALLQEFIDFFKQDEEDTGPSWDELPEKEKQAMLDSMERAEKGIGTISWEEYQRQNPQWFKK